MTAGRAPVRRASRCFGKFLRVTLGWFLLVRYNVAAENRPVVRRLKPPYVILANHFTNWDPFFLGCFIPHPVYNVTSDAPFRRSIVRFLLGLVGAIPKTKVVSDLGTVKKVFAVAKMGGVIGIYAEGRRSWDGHTSSIPYSTAKLLKVMRLPVVVAIMKGGYLSHPRWARHRRRGRILFEFEVVLDADQTKRLSATEIHERVVAALDYDEYSYQRSRMVAYRGRALAERLELALFVCPSCKEIATLSSQNRSFSCFACGYRVRYTPQGFFDTPDHAPLFATVRDWNLWQLAQFESNLAEALRLGSQRRLVHDAELVSHVGYRAKPLRRFRGGDLSLYIDRIEFATPGHGQIDFPLVEIEGINVQVNERLEFYFRGVLYRFQSRSLPFSGYKWMNGVEILQRLTTGHSSSEAR